MKITAKMVDKNPNMPEWRDADHWRCLLTHEGRRMTVYYSKGFGHHGKAPELDEVLETLLTDDPQGMSFDEWCSELGYDTDSRKALATYNKLGEHAEKLRNLMGFDAYEAAREALYK